MLNITNISKIVEKMYYNLLIIKTYSDANSDLEEILPIKYSLDLIIEDLDKIYARIINEKIL